jgi:hypothetical protein
MTEGEKKLAAEIARDTERAIRHAKIWGDVFDRMFAPRPAPKPDLKVIEGGKP